MPIDAAREPAIIVAAQISTTRSRLAAAPLAIRGVAELSIKSFATCLVMVAGALLPQAISAAGAPPGDDSSAVPASVAGGRKYHPGHYIALLRGSDSQGAMVTAIQPGVVGIMKRYSWPALEPTPGHYDLSAISADLNWAAAHGMHLVIMVEDKTFKEEIPTPAYLSKYVLHNHGGGYTTLRWVPAVASAFKSLVQAIGARFDANPWFEGLATQETALGFPYKVLVANGYTAEKYRDMYLELLTAAAKAMPNSRVFWFMNFIPVKEQYVATIASAVAPLGVAMGGPDIMPENKHLLRKPYPYYSQFFSKMPLFAQVEGVCYDQPHIAPGYSTKYWTMPELFNFGLTKLHVNYMFWMRITDPPVRDSYDWLDALPVIAQHPVFVPK
jgi:hypothetical protein